MLVLSRKIGEKIVIGGNITITVLESPIGHHGRVRLGIDAPKEIAIHRLEVQDRFQAPHGEQP